MSLFRLYMNTTLVKCTNRPLNTQDKSGKTLIPGYTTLRSRLVCRTGGLAYEVSSPASAVPTYVGENAGAGVDISLDCAGDCRYLCEHKAVIFSTPKRFLG